MAARKDAARPRRPRAAAPRPLTESQLMDVRRAVQSVRGAGARSVKVHGIVVYLDKELTLPKPNSQTRLAPSPAPESASSAAAMRLDDAPTTSKQRRSRRRLQQRIEQRAARAAYPAASSRRRWARSDARCDAAYAERSRAARRVEPLLARPQIARGGAGRSGRGRANTCRTMADAGEVRQACRDNAVNGPSGRCDETQGRQGVVADADRRDGARLARTSG